MQSTISNFFCPIQIECAIDAWATGVKVEVPFYSTEYKQVWVRHVNTLEEYGVATEEVDLLGKLQRLSYAQGR